MVGSSSLKHMSLAFLIKSQLAFGHQPNNTSGYHWLAIWASVAKEYMAAAYSLLEFDVLTFVLCSSPHRTLFIQCELMLEVNTWSGKYFVLACGTKLVKGLNPCHLTSGLSSNRREQFLRSFLTMFSIFQLPSTHWQPTTLSKCRYGSCTLHFRCGMCAFHATIINVRLQQSSILEMAVDCCVDFCLETSSTEV